MKVLSSLAIKEAYLELAPAFEAKSGKKLDTSWLGMVDIRKRMQSGESADVVIGSAALLAELKSAGNIASIVPLAKSGVAVAVRKGAKHPDLSSGEAVKRGLRAAKSIAYSSGPSGVYLSQLFEKWGIAEELKARITQTPPGTAVGPLVARGEAELGFQQMSELLPIPGIDIVGPLPADIQTVTTFSGGVHSASKEAGAAKAWLESIAAAKSVLKKHGMEAA